jgi:hypothetical protein
LRARGESDIEPVLADVDADKVYKVHGIIPVLAIVCGRESLPTIQAVRKRGWGTKMTTVVQDLIAIGPHPPLSYHTANTQLRANGASHRASFSTPVVNDGLWLAR